MDDDSRAVDKGWDLPEYAEQTADDAVTLSISTGTGASDWLVNTMDSVVVPMSTAEVVEALRGHKLTDRSLVWRNGMPEWTSIDRVPSLKLAARMPSTLGPSKPSQPAPAAPTPTPSAVATPNAPPAHGKPSASPSARPSQSATQSPRPNPTPAVGLSRRATLPFGLPGPHPSRPSHAKPSSPPSAPPPRSEEPEVLAVYDRPAATISFDLSPSEPARVPPPPAEQPASARPAPTPPPQTLAPTTTDTRNAPRSTPAPRYNPDLSVVAASHFRDVQRSSKRRLLLSSLGSAVAASALTLWLSGAAPWARFESKAPPRAPEAAAALPAPAAAVPAPAPSAATPAVPPSDPAPVAAASSAAPSAPPSAPLAQAVAAALAKPKPAAPKAKPVSAAPRAPDPARVAQRESKGEPNPYDVKLEDESAAQPSSKPPTRGLLEMMKESDGPAPAPEPVPPEASAATGSTSPGF